MNNSRYYDLKERLHPELSGLIPPPGLRAPGGFDLRRIVLNMSQKSISPFLTHPVGAPGPRPLFGGSQRSPASRNPENVSPNPPLEAHGNDECVRCAVSGHQGAVSPTCSDRVHAPSGRGSPRDQRSQRIKGWRSPGIPLRIHRVQLVPSHISACACLKVTLNISEHECRNILA